MPSIPYPCLNQAVENTDFPILNGFVGLSYTQTFTVFPTELESCYPQVSVWSFSCIRTSKCISLFILSSCDSSVPHEPLCCAWIVCVSVCAPSSSLHVRLVTVLHRTTSRCETVTQTSSWTKETWRWPTVTQPSQPTEPRPPPAPKDRPGAGAWTANAATAHLKTLWNENWIHVNMSSWAVAHV